MKPYYVIRVGIPTERETFILANRREIRITYDESQQSEDEMGRDQVSFGVDSLKDAEAMLSWLTNRFPSNSYMIVQSIKAGYREPGELKFGVFTTEGFMPE